MACVYSKCCKELGGSNGGYSYRNYASELSFGSPQCFKYSNCNGNYFNSFPESTCYVSNGACPRTKVIKGGGCNYFTNAGCTISCGSASEITGSGLLIFFAVLLGILIWRIKLSVNKRGSPTQASLSGRPGVSV